MNIRFINREKELSALASVYAGTEERGRLGVVYGRRRLGKTTLLRRFADGRPHCCYVADRAGPVDARRNLAELMAVQVDEPTLSGVRYDTWYDLFAAYDRLRNPSQPQLLVLDEYQYLCEADPAFSYYVQKWWDEHWRSQRLMLVLCGSVTSMMYKETLSASSPLYGRADLQLLLKPMRFRCLSEFFPEADWRRRVELFALAGGIPRYLEMADASQSLFDNLVRLVLAPTAPLRDEGRYLLQEEVSSPNTYWSILQTLGQGVSRISELAGRLNQPASKLTRYLSVLRDLRLVEREVPICESNPDRSKKGIYRVADPFMALWFGVAQPFESFFQFGDASRIESRILPRLQTHVAETFERVCRQWLEDRALDYGLVCVGRQWDRHREFDVVGVDENRRIRAVGECKWSDSPMQLHDLNRLQEKLSVANLPIDNPIILLFSKSGFSQQLHNLAKADANLRLVDNLP